MAELSSPSCVGWQLWVLLGLPIERDQLQELSLPQAAPWAELEFRQHPREARRCPVPLALPTGDLPLWDPRLAGSVEHSITPGSHRDRPPCTYIPPQSPACWPPAPARGRIPPSLPDCRHVMVRGAGTSLPSPLSARLPPLLRAASETSQLMMRDAEQMGDLTLYSPAVD